MQALVNAILDNGIFDYHLKPAELIWAAVTGIAAYVTAAGIESPTDWQPFAFGVFMAAVRPVIAIVLGRRPEAAG